MSSLLIKNIKILATMDGSEPFSTGQELKDYSILCVDGIIKDIFPSKERNVDAEQVINASSYLVLPGLINTHHHLFQTLTKAIRLAQNANLFDWLKTLYPIWAKIKPIHLKSSVSIGLSELILSGCTTTSDHLYIFPNGVELEDEIEIAKKIGIRFHATRGSMSVGESLGGLPPDFLVEKEESILSDSIRVVEKWNDPKHNSMLRIALAPCSPFSVSQDLMKETAIMARDLNVGLHTHFAENDEDVKYCNQILKMSPGQYLESIGWLGPDVWHAHCVKLNDYEINLMSSTNTKVSHCPCSNMRLGSGIAPIKELLNNKVSVGLGVDGSASNDSGNLLNEARQSLLLQRVVHGSSGLTARQALWMATAGGAETLNRDDIGKIKVGNSADFSIFNLNSLELSGAIEDPLSGLIFCGPFKTVYTICNGSVIAKNGEIVNLDLYTAIEKHNDLSKSLLVD